MRTHTIALLLTLAMIGPARAQAADEPLVKAVVTPEQEMRDDGAHPEHRFPLTLADGVDPASLHAYVVGVTARGKSEPDLIAAFTPEIRALPSPDPILVLRVDFALASAPATYEIEIALSAKQAGGALRQNVKVRLTHPAAQLRVEDKIVFRRSWLLVPLGLYPTALTLGETTGRSQLSGITIEQVSPAIHDDEPVEGRLVFAAPATLAPGALATAPLSLDGPFPVGVTRGTIQVRAAQLEAPVVVPYELRVRLPSWIIPLAFLAGAGLGYLIRVRLKKREERLARELAIKDLTERVERLEARSGPEDQAQLLAAIRALTDKIDSAEDTAKAMKAAEDLILRVVESRAAAQRDLIAQTEAALAVIGRGWTLPRAVDPAPVAKAFEEAQRCAVNDDLHAAEVARGDAVTRTRALARASHDWASALGRRIAKLEEAKLPAHADLAPAVAELRASLAKVPGGDTAPGLELLLQAVHAANTAALALVEQVADALADAADQAAHAMTDPDRATAVREAAALPEAPLTDADEAMAHLIEAAHRLDAAMTAAIAARMPSRAGDRVEVQALLDDGRYAEAMSKVEAMVAATPQFALSLSEPGDDVPHVPPSAPPAAPPRRFLSLFSRGPEPRTGGEMRVIVMAPARAPALDDRATVERQLGQTRAAMTVLSATILAMLTWAFYGRQFFGTAQELLTLVALGFTTDLSTDALLAALDKAKKS